MTARPANGSRIIQILCRAQGCPGQSQKEVKRAKRRHIELIRRNGAHLAIWPAICRRLATFDVRRAMNSAAQRAGRWVVFILKLRPREIPVDNRNAALLRRRYGARTRTERADVWGAIKRIKQSAVSLAHHLQGSVEPTRKRSAIRGIYLEVALRVTRHRRHRFRLEENDFRASTGCTHHGTSRFRLFNRVQQMPVLNTARAHVQPGAAGKRRIRR